MAKFQSPLLGYNNNVRHKNRVFHIQTEDSGVNHPHIITHLFMDGGRILKSVKKSYAEHVGVEGMSETVRGLMKEQHKAMFIALRDGQFDSLVDGGSPPKPPAASAADAAAAAAPVAAPAVAPPAAPVVVVPAPVAHAAAAVAPAALPAVAAARAPAPAPDPLTPSSPELPVVSASIAPATHPAPPRTDPEPSIDVAVELVPVTLDESHRAASLAPPPAPAAHVRPAPRLVLAEPDTDDVPMTTRQPPEARPDAAVASAKTGAPGLTLDLAALENNARDAASPSLFHSADLPPPPKNLFAKEPGSGGAYRAFEADPRHDPREGATGARIDPREERAPRGDGRNFPSPPPSSQRGEKAPQPPRAAGAPGSSRVPAGGPAEARYAPARPAAIFGSTQRPPPASIFSDELVSDKSLDEVILSYLAEDLEQPRRK